ncbi:MAG TPA: nuclear transport factor 2 family protein [Alphaproteobacteria bacterium]|nr:nuclear transport factor 2 family protein [Alphaproteobacteria bacterium]
MTDDTNLSRLQNAYHVWHDTKGASASTWLDLMSDEVGIFSMGEEAAGLSFAKDRQNKHEVVEYLTGLLADWTMVHWTPEIYVREGDRIAMFGHTAWTNKATGKTAETRIAHLWQFDDGKIVEFTEVFDSARVVAASNA